MYKHPLSRSLSLFFSCTHIKVGNRVHDALLFSLLGLRMERNGGEWSNDRENDRGEIEISIRSEPCQLCSWKDIGC